LNRNSTPEGIWHFSNTEMMGCGDRGITHSFVIVVRERHQQGRWTMQGSTFQKTNLQVSRTAGVGGILDCCALPWREVTTAYWEQLKKTYFKPRTVSFIFQTEREREAPQEDWLPKMQIQCNLYICHFSIINISPSRIILSAFFCPLWPREMGFSVDLLLFWHLD